MSQFFHGWRRTIGVITLLMALAFMGGWVRSLFFSDFLILPTLRNRDAEWPDTYLCSSRQYLVIFPELHVYQGTTFLSTKIGESRIFDNPTIDWQWSYLGFGSGFRGDRTFIAAPYWSIVIPLTLLSAWLLISKSRQRQTTVGPVTETIA